MLKPSVETALPCISTFSGLRGVKQNRKKTIAMKSERNNNTKSVAIALGLVFFCRFFF